MSDGRELDLTRTEIAEAALSLGADNPKFLSGRTLQQQARLKRFLVVLARTGRLVYSAREAGYAHTGPIHRVRKEDPAFDAAFHDAMTAAGDLLEEEAVRRAVDGVEEDVYHQGAPVGTKLVYSDGLLQLLLKGAKKDKYANHSKQETTVTGGFGVALLPVASTDAAQWAEQAAATHAAQKASQKEIIEGEFSEAVEGESPISLDSIL